MLYDILPPLFLFVSLGGIILIVSRVVARIKRQELSRAIQTEGMRSGAPAHQLLEPGRNRIRLASNRAAAAALALARWLRDRRQEKKEVPATGIRQPHSSWRDRLVAASRRLRKPAVPTSTPLAEIPAPKITVRALKRPFPEEKPPEKARRSARKSPLESAETAVEQGHFSAAEDMLVPFIAKHPDSVPAYILLGRAAIGQHAWEEAIEIFDQVLRVDPAAREAYAWLGRAALKAGRLTRALEALQRALDADPANTRVLKDLLTLAQHMDNKILQKTVIERLLALEPDNPRAHAAADALDEAKLKQKAQV